MAFANFGNSAFDARPYSLTGQTFDKPGYAQNRFGATFGGQLPKTHTQYTVNYQGNTDKNSFSGYATVPTELERAGDFSRALTAGPVTIYDPDTKAPFPGNTIPASRVDPASLGLLAYIPLPNRPGSIQNYQLVTSIPRNTNAVSTRINQSLNQKHHFPAASIGRIGTARRRRSLDTAIRHPVMATPWISDGHGRSRRRQLTTCDSDSTATAARPIRTSPGASIRPASWASKALRPNPRTGVRRI